MAALRAFWSPQVFWPTWLGAFAAAFLLREIWALGSGRPQDTLSDWDWHELNVIPGVAICQWDAAHLLTFGLWLVLFTWLTGHFFFRVWA